MNEAKNETVSRRKRGRRGTRPERANALARPESLDKIPAHLIAGLLRTLSRRAPEADVQL
ncbi:MAG: hypothetical protein KBC74_00525 [Candidatus Pacebacteria bacterium]|nr:hypothetical protein [Candidatus Paceibacterota bacterium]MBP9831998.1 hypothetical protein [Candidatus Paceibacterota bacterium]